MSLVCVFGITVSFWGYACGTLTYGTPATLYSGVLVFALLLCYLLSEHRTFLVAICAYGHILFAIINLWFHSECLFFICSHLHVAVVSCLNH